MSEFKGTKEKWVISTGVLTSDNLEHVIITPQEQIKERKGYRAVCSISPLEHFDKEDQANALLISKAPEMLEMLKDILDCYNSGDVYHEYKIKQLIKEATEI